MIKIHAHIQKKVPLPGYEYSSQAFSAGLEVEASDGGAEAIRARVHELYQVLDQAVNEQINAASAAGAETDRNGAQPAPRRANLNAPRARSNGNGGNGSARGNGARRASNRVKATAAQCRAIYAIAKDLGLEIRDALAGYNAADAADLHIADASRLIDELKSRQADNAARR